MCIRDRLRLIKSLSFIPQGIIFLYFFINCAMITGLIPIVGVPIPMLSYGGSAIISLCAAMGFVLNARRQRDIKIESILDA